MHEIAEVTILLSEHGDDLAKRYMDYEAVQVGKESCEYQLYAERLGEVPLSEETMQDISNQRKEVAGLYGAEFCRAYGWASSIINKKKIDFKDLEKAASIDHLRPYYQLASASVHSNVDCIAGKNDLMPDTDIVLAGPSNYGLYEPGANTDVSLYQVNIAAILSIKPSVSNLLIIKTMELLVQEISRAFQDAEERFEQINMQGKTV